MAINFAPIQAEAFKPTVPDFQKGFQQGLENYVKMHQAKYAPQLLEQELKKSQAENELNQMKLHPELAIQKYKNALDALSNIETSQKSQTTNQTLSPFMSHTLGAKESEIQGGMPELLNQLMQNTDLRQKISQQPGFLDELTKQGLKNQPVETPLEQKPASLIQDNIKRQLLKNITGLDIDAMSPKQMEDYKHKLAVDKLNEENKLKIETESKQEEMKSQRAWKQERPAQVRELNKLKQAYAQSKAHPEWFGAGLWGGDNRFTGPTARKLKMDKEGFGDLEILMGDILANKFKSTSTKGLASIWNFLAQNKPNFYENPKIVQGKLKRLISDLEDTINDNDTLYGNENRTTLQQSYADPLGLRG